MIVRNYRDLKVWQKAMDLVVASYDLTRQFPQSELYGLVSQTQRGAVSIPANIAEGHGRAHLGDYLHHLSVANGSLMELETHCLLASRLGSVLATEVEHILEKTGEISRMLSGLTRSLKLTRSAPNT